MDVLSPLLELLFRALVVVLPLTVTFLSFRRLLLSQSSNAWIYAATCLFTSVTTIGLLPWTLGFAEASSLFFLFSAISPLVWMSVIMLCDPISLTSNYDREDDALDVDTPEEPVIPLRKRPLVLEKPDWPEAPVAVFRHAASDTADPTPSAAKMADDTSAGRALLSIARGMRGNETSDARRPKMLPAPKGRDLHLPFLTRS